MKALVTGSSGFAGRWLMRDLTGAGHEAVPDRLEGDRVEIMDREAVGEVLRRTRPDVVFHLAAMAFGPDADADPTAAFQANVGGTAVLMDAMRRLEAPAAIVVVSSAEVYGQPEPGGELLDEAAPTLPTRIYGLSKLAQESVALALAGPYGLRVAVIRPFNHTGPGQRQEFAIPAFATRLVVARSTGARAIRVGNVEVRRDIGDVRDTVRAYRLVGEALVEGRIETGLRLNVATGVPVRIASIIERLSGLAGYPVGLEVDPELVRANDPATIAGDAALLRRVTGWVPEIPLDQTLRDVLEDVEQRVALAV